jgi:hypothetical protein
MVPTIGGWIKQRIGLSSERPNESKGDAQSGRPPAPGLGNLHIQGNKGKQPAGKVAQVTTANHRTEIGGDIQQELPPGTGRSGRETVGTTLRQTLHMSDEKADEILKGFGEELLGERGETFSQRVRGLSVFQKWQLKTQLHYSSGTASRTTREERHAGRTAVALAFAKGATMEQIKATRRNFDAASPALRTRMLEILNQPGPYQHVEFVELTPQARRQALDELKAANARSKTDAPLQARGADHPERLLLAQAQRATILDDLETTPNPGSKDMAVYVGGSAVAIMRLDRGTSQASRDSRGVRSVLIEYMAGHPKFRGLGEIMIEKAMQEAVALEPSVAQARSVALTPIRNGHTRANAEGPFDPRKGPCVVLSAASDFLRGHYADHYGFTLYDPDSTSTVYSGQMELLPEQTTRWSRQHNGQYALSEKKPAP